MIIYNITVKIDKEVEEDWVRWMVDKHIPDVMATGYFERFSFQKVLQSFDPDNTYAVQYFAEKMSKLHKYEVEFAPALKKEHAKRYPDKFVAIRTILDELHKGDDSF